MSRPPLTSHPPPTLAGLRGNGDYAGGESVVAPRVRCEVMARADEIASVAVLVQGPAPLVYSLVPTTYNAHRELSCSCWRLALFRLIEFCPQSVRTPVFF